MHMESSAQLQNSGDSDSEDSILEDSRDDPDINMQYSEEHIDQGFQDTEMEETNHDGSIVPKGRLDGSNGSPIFAPNSSNAALPPHTTDLEKYLMSNQQL
uniref:AlNc14C34G3093 protein n=1 Tax=Albugo laibachii Nc14 TaxID=890382 RepID=F0W8G3_9STRA|nr:AlNc14C34G3093 [Albugo laibachii Nc14]|eukprot:CCA17418.1 AlNc14C34G3093 [Albugo laibachii Nc14]